MLFSGTYIINRHLKELDPVAVNAQNSMVSFFISALMFITMSDSWQFDATVLVLGAINGLMLFVCGLMFIKASQL